MELHHIHPKSEGGEDSIDNCVPLCFDCHADAGHYNPKHPKGIKYSPTELKRHRDEWYSMTRNLNLEEIRVSQEVTQIPIEAYEAQEIELEGFVWRESFPGPPNYESFITDSKETYWMFILPKSITLFAESFEHGNTYRIDGIKKLQLLVNGEFYDSNKGIVLKTIRIQGKLIQSHTGHHHGQALFEVSKLLSETPSNELGN